MALVDDDVAKIVFWVVLAQKTSVVLRFGVGVAADVERLIGGDEDARILLRILSCDEPNFTTEDVVESPGCLFGELRPVAHEEGVRDVACCGELVQKLA